MAEPRTVISPACRERVCDGCTGYSGDYDTYRCDCRCHEDRAGWPHAPQGARSVSGAAVHPAQRAENTANEAFKGVTR